MNPPVIEFYIAHTTGGIYWVESYMVPPVGSFISIEKRTYEVVKVTYALDYADESSRRMRANVDLRLINGEK